ncbi:MAG: M14 family metallopeptidase [Bacteroidetes bacterium]|nr:M14 family metallopeptidase [Bacteroidota bacterium]
MKHFSIGILLLALAVPAFAQQGWLTDYERSGGVASPDYQHTLAYLQRLDSASAWVELQFFGTTPEGRKMPLVILSKDGCFTPEAARKSGKEVVLIQSGIHAGEIDGKDASMMLLREIAITGSLADLADDVIVLFMPIFNLDGHERISPYNRINQNGPEEMGWRTTAQNLNLNRDYMKADAPEMRAWLRTFNAWGVDMLIDCHVTDGIDFQYNATYAMETHGNMAPPVSAWEKKLAAAFLRGMARAGDPLAPYVFPREDHDLSKGLVDWASAPRLSTGYAAVRNRANLLIETHMLKPYKDRVTATYRLLIEVLRYMNANSGDLHDAIEEAEEEDVRRITEADTTAFPLQFRSVGQSGTISFLGYASEMRKSAISGGEYEVWDHARPITVEIPFFGDVRPVAGVHLPRYYFIPQEWQSVTALLQLHSVRMQRLTEAVTVAVERSVFADAKWRERPYEGRFPVQFTSTTRIDTVTYPAGTWVVDLAQPAMRVAVNLLEPDAPDSFVYWGFFTPVFEQKEYFEEYVMAPIAEDMSRDNPALREEFERKLASDSAFAASPRARLQFFYERSPWFDTHMNVYPVGRGMKFQALPMVTSEEFDEMVRSR